MCSSCCLWETPLTTEWGMLDTSGQSQSSETSFKITFLCVSAPALFPPPSHRSRSLATAARLRLGRVLGHMWRNLLCSASPVTTYSTSRNTGNSKTSSFKMSCLQNWHLASKLREHETSSCKKKSINFRINEFLTSHVQVSKYPASMALMAWSALGDFMSPTCVHSSVSALYVRMWVWELSPSFPPAYIKYLCS